LKVLCLCAGWPADEWISSLAESAKKTSEGEASGDNTVLPDLICAIMQVFA
jgi:hypothetical protein